MLFLSNNKIHACGGSWMVKADLISSGQFDEITRLTKKAIATMLGFEFAHLGTNEKNTDLALHSADLFSQMFNFPVKEGNSSIFSASSFEVMKSKHLGEHGHVAIASKDIKRALFYLEMKGITVLPETAK